MVTVELAGRLRATWGSRSRRLLTVARLGGLGALEWAVVDQQQRGVPGERQMVPTLLLAAGIAWVGWMAARGSSARAPIVAGCLAVLAVSGGLLVPYAPVAIAFVAVAALGAGIALQAPVAVAVGAAGAVTLLIGVLGLGSPSAGEVIAEGVLSAVAGVMAGFSRRQYLGRAHQAEELLAARVRADAERDRATALAERNRLGREVHDVLAHSLGALAVQLEAVDALLEGGSNAERARLLVQEARRLAVDGLDETRQAVRALRADPVELSEQLQSLASREGAELTVHGPCRPVEAETALALYRAAQEALTNARKHAPGGTVIIRLAFHQAETVLDVVNGPSPNGLDPNPLSRSGGGFGLKGMRERVELRGGNVRATPTPSGGFEVHVAVPA